MLNTPPYVETNVDGGQVSRLPNALREHLLTFDNGVSILRVWESLLLAGFQPGQVFTRHEASDALVDGVGRPALDTALRFALNGERLFRIKGRFYPTNIASIREGENLKSFAGAPPLVYAMPSITEVCTALRLNSQPGDPLRAADLQSVGTYRGGMHRELIKQRMSKKGDQKWQSERLGVTDRTIRRYTKTRYPKS